MDMSNVLSMIEGDNYVDVVTKLDKMARAQELVRDVQSSLQRIRRLKQDLKQEEANLKELLRTNIEEDKELTDLLGELSDGEKSE